MIKAIGLRKIDVTEEEYDYYQELVKRYSDEKTKGSEYFTDQFNTDKKGIITAITITKSVPWEILFFLQNLMINQHLRSFDARINQIEERLGLTNG